jgi:tetratricopeptide (TPR) repeat protein
MVIAPYANVRDIKNTDSIAQVVHDLGVEWLIRGSIGVEGNDSEMTLELVSSSGAVIWKTTLSGRPVTMLDLAKRNILDALHLKASTDRKIEQVRTQDVSAYQKYLEARNRQEGWDIEGNAEEAVRLYRASLEIDPDFSAARAGLATALLKQFDQKHEPAFLSLANEEAQRALALDSNLPEVLLAYGWVQLEYGKSIEARDAFAKALELAPGDDSACRSLADVYSLLGRNKEAEEMYKHAIALRPSFWRNHYAYGTFLWQYAGNPDGARDHLQKAVELHPEGFAPLVMMGNLHLTRGELQDAETYFRKALQQSQNTYAYNNLGLVYYYRGQYDLALRNWEAVLKDSPNKPLYQANVGDALRRLGRYEEAKDRYMQAIEGFRESLKINPLDDVARAGLVMALAATGGCKEATAEMRGMLSRHPENTVLAEYAAIAVSRCGDLNWAKQIALNSIAKNNLLVIRFDPDLEPVRQLPEVKKALDLAMVSAHQ